jgi:RluA family pseudouridine synthase
VDSPSPAPIPPAALRLTAGRETIGVVFADAHLLALNKPAGLLAVRDRWDAARENLADLLRAAVQRGDAWARAMGYTYLANVHRLDAPTSGIMVFAASREDLGRLVRAFRERAVTKSYLALVRGAPPSDTFAIDLPIAPDPRHPGRVRTGGGKPARTDFEVLERFRGFTLVQARPVTGRQHQIRVHLRAAGCPIVGDADYGDGRPLMLSGFKRNYRETSHLERPLIGRLALHAHRLALAHPATGAPLDLEAPPPKDFAASLNCLRKYALASRGPRS